MRFGKVGFLVLLLATSLLSACGQKDVIFSGESDNWRIQLEYIQMGEYIENTGYIKYIGTEPIPKEIEYSITSNSSGMGPLQDNGVFSLPKSGGGCSGCTPPSDDSEFDALIQWNNQSETIILTKE